ncbi:Phosphoric ester [Madurella fahalii]|uniref:Phosphoric ester n=1 Tax=Madurella fahalii TaxID=1157608 RepID=A0ABQ0G9I3_9PEZI
MPLFARKRTGLEALLHRPRPGIWEQFLAQPCVFLARTLYTWRQPLPAQPVADPVSVVCVSDTHNSQPALPNGDVLIHAGDLTQSGSSRELQETIDWLRAQSHPVKIVIAGNHDLLLIRVKMNDAAPETRTTATCPNGRQLRVYGSPYSARHGNWAFQYPRSDNIWAGTVPRDVDILVTHGPPRAHLDLLRLGCVYLLRELWQVRPRLHIFGHIHEGAGTEWLPFDALQDAYERTAIAGGGIWNLLRTLNEFLRVLFRTEAEAKCLLVNPAIVGGLRDNERRRPIKVVIWNFTSKDRVHLIASRAQR